MSTNGANNSDRRGTLRSRCAFVWKRLPCVLREFSFYQMSVYAGNAAFFLLLSFFPLVTLILSLLQFLPIDAADLIAATQIFLPESVLPVVEYIFGMRNPGAVFSLSVIVAIWSASRGTYGVLRGLNRAFGLRETRSYLHVRLTCVRDTLLLVAAILAALLLYVFGRPFAALLEAGPLAFLVNPLFRFLLATLLLILLFCLVYRILPDHRVSFRSVLPGAVLSGAGWMGYSALYSYYVNHFSGMSKLYGGLTAVAVTMLWLYVCMEILFFGGVLNRCSGAI